MFLNSVDLSVRNDAGSKQTVDMGADDFNCLFFEIGAHFAPINSATTFVIATLAASGVLSGQFPLYPSPPSAR